MPRCFGRLLLWLLLPTLAGAATPLENARRAGAMLGAEVWQRVVRIENSARRSSYPETTYALVFEFGGILWFYTDVNGTQSFSLHFNNLAAEKTDFGPLLREVEPRFGKWTIMPAGRPVRTRGSAEPLPNGCFIESVAALRERMARGEPSRRARLLCYYWNASEGRVGHTVLAFETLAGAFVVDPQMSAAPLHVGRRLADDPLVVAEEERPELAMTGARWVPVDASSQPPRVASLAGGSRAAVWAKDSGVVR